jgi:hypothetical protein
VPKPTPDLRLVSTTLASPAVLPSGQTAETGSWIVLTEMTRLQDRSVVAFNSPHPPSFYLLTARTLRDMAVTQRDQALASVQTMRSGELAVTDDGVLLDAFGSLAAAVLLCLAAIEAAANAAIDHLPDSAVVVVERASTSTAIPKAEMVRRLSLSEKLHDLALVLSVPQIKGTAVWELFVKLRRLRDDLVHVKQRGYSNDPDAPSPFGQLFRGDATCCVEHARDVILALWPEGLVPLAQQQLTATRPDEP